MQLDNPHDIIVNVDNINMTPDPAIIAQISIPIPPNGTFEEYRMKYADPVSSLLTDVKNMIDTEEYPYFAYWTLNTGNSNRDQSHLYYDYLIEKDIFTTNVRNVGFRGRFQHVFYRMEELIATIPHSIDILFDELIVCVKILKQICKGIRCEFLLGDVKNRYHFIYESL